MNLLDFIEFNRYNLDLLLAGLVAYLALIWAAVLFWVWRDISSRSRGIIAAIGAVMLVFFGNILGLIVYLLVRPEHTLEEKESHQLFHTSVVDKDITACGHCSTLVRVDYKFCPNCQHNLEHRCPECKVRIHPEWNYCISCSTRLYPASTQEKLRGAFGGAAWAIFNVPTFVIKGISAGWKGYLNFISGVTNNIENLQSRLTGKKKKTIVTNKDEKKNDKQGAAKVTTSEVSISYNLQDEINTLLKAEVAPAVEKKQPNAQTERVASKPAQNTVVEQAVVDESLDRVLSMFSFGADTNTSEA